MMMDERPCSILASLDEGFSPCACGHLASHHDGDDPGPYRCEQCDCRDYGAARWDGDDE